MRGDLPSNINISATSFLFEVAATATACYLWCMSYQLTPTGQAIREIRKARGIRQRDVAEATNISASHLCRIEKGERVATQRVATAIYQYLGVEAA